MLKFILRRASLIIPTFFGITLLTFTLIRLVPGDPIEARSGERGISPERLAYFRHELGLDQPLWKQYLDYIWQVLHGDLGISIATKDTVWHEFINVFPATLELALLAMVFAIIVGLPFGVIAAVRRGSVFDYGLIGVSVTGASMPIPWWGLMLILFFSVNLGLTPVSGRIDAAYSVDSVTGFYLLDTLFFSDDEGAFLSALRYMILPAIVLGTIPLAVIARMTRSSMLEVLGEDYVRTARAKGLSGTRVVVVHALRNALIPVVTSIGLQIGALMGGAILTETIFSRPGVGSWLVEAVQRRDYTVLQGGVLIVATLVMLVNLAVDLTYGFLNPRIRR